MAILPVERRSEARDDDRGAPADHQSSSRAELTEAAELEHGRAQAALDAEQRLRAQLEKDLIGTQKGLEAAEKARDTAIKTLEQARHPRNLDTQAAALAGGLPAGREIGSEKRHSRYLTMPEDHLPAIIRLRAPAELRRELALAEGYAASAFAPSTRKAYEHDWLVFATWCAECGVQAIPATPATVAAFLAAEAYRGFRPVTIGRRGCDRRRTPRAGSSEPL